MSRVSGGSADRRFRHEAVFYRGLDDLASTAVPFVRDGLERGEPVLVAVLPDRIRTLRSALGQDADGVTFLDMAEVGGNPARIIPVWRRFLHDFAGAGPVRGIGEPVWTGRSDIEVEECRLHESLLNVAFDDGPAWRLLCPYDAATLPTGVVEDAMRTHPTTAPASTEIPYGGHAYAQASFACPLPPVPPSAHRAPFAAEDLTELRYDVRARSRSAGLSAETTAHAVLAAHELATNSILHGGGKGVLYAWTDPGAFVIEVSDHGTITDPLIGRELAADLAEGGRGVWMVNQLCDLVQVRSVETRTAIRLHFWL